MKSRWKTDLDNVVDNFSSLHQVHDLLVKMKNSGISQTEVCNYLESAIAHANETTEDRILEVLDIATGWCSPEYKVW